MNRSFPFNSPSAASAYTERETERTAEPERAFTSVGQIASYIAITFYLTDRRTDGQCGQAKGQAVRGPLGYNPVDRSGPVY